MDDRDLLQPIVMADGFRVMEEDLVLLERTTAMTVASISYVQKRRRSVLLYPDIFSVS